MLNVLSGVINQGRFVEEVAAAVIASGIEGQWVVPQSSGGFNFEAGALVAYQIWTESSKDGSVGFSKDSVYLSKVTLLEPGYRAITDQFDGSPTVGAKLKTTAAGKLEVEESTDPWVAVCTKAPYNYTYNGSTISVIEIQVGG